MGQLHDAIAAALAAELDARTEWDEHPALYFLALRSKQARLIDVDVPLLFWRAGRAPDVLEKLAVSLAVAGVAPNPPPGWVVHGAAFRHEGWWVDVDMKHDLPAAKHAAALAAEHRLVDHPQRVEIRQMYAVDRAGITYSSTQYRGEGAAETMISYPTGRAVAHGPHVEEALGGTTGPMKVQPTGAVVEALDLIVSVLTGVELPARASAYLEDHLKGGRP
jgi:hypothetical protein